MERKKYKQLKVLPFIGAVFGAAGLILTAVGVILFADHISFNKKNPSVNAVIENIEIVNHRKNGKTRSTKNVYIAYEYAEKEYHNKLGYYVTGMKVGDSVKIHCSEANPEKIKGDRYIAEIIVSSLGVLYAGLGAGMLVHYAKKKKRIRYLLENGIRMYATVTNVLTDYHTKVNGAHPIYLLCQITDSVTGESTVYKSESTFEDLTRYIGMNVDIYADPSNPKDAYVDLKALIENQNCSDEQVLTEKNF